MQLRLTSKARTCERCGGLAQYRVERESKEPDAYYDDKDGNLQMKLKTVVETADVCETHLVIFLDRSYELTARYATLKPISEGDAK